MSVSHLQISDTRDATYYLRGFALGIVLVNHYINLYITDTLTFYANGAVGVFFLLSGYGIFHALSREFRDEGLQFGGLVRFYLGRALRIAPLYWIFLLVWSVTEGTVPPIYVWLGIPLGLAPGVGWFVTLLIQCYLVAPFLYVLLQKIGVAKYTAVAVGGLLLLWLVAMVQPVSIPYTSVYSYRHLTLGHISLFSFGLAMPNLIRGFPRRPPWVLLPVSLSLFLILLHFTRFQYFELSRYLAPLFVLSTLALCSLVILVKPRLVFGKVLILVGTYSYSVYLFHVSFYQVLERIGGQEFGPWIGIVFVFLALPPFLILCILLERLTGAATRRVQLSLQRGR